jgi:hypothetical protein
MRWNSLWSDLVLLQAGGVGVGVAAHPEGVAPGPGVGVHVQNQPFQQNVQMTGLPFFSHIVDVAQERETYSWKRGGKSGGKIQINLNLNTSPPKKKLNL